MVNQTEATVLIRNKKLEGKSYEQIGNELKIFSESQILLKNQTREINYLNKELNKKDLEIAELKKELGKNKNTRLIEGLKTIEPKITASATILNAKRIIKFMELEKPYRKSDFYLEFSIPTTVVEEIIDFLSKYTNVKIEKVENKYIRHES